MIQIIQKVTGNKVNTDNYRRKYFKNSDEH